jgi:hypothetical protein
VHGLVGDDHRGPHVRQEFAHAGACRQLLDIPPRLDQDLFQGFVAGGQQDPSAAHFLEPATTEHDPDEDQHQHQGADQSGDHEVLEAVLLGACREILPVEACRGDPDAFLGGPEGLSLGHELEPTVGGHQQGERLTFAHRGDGGALAPDGVVELGEGALPRRPAPYLPPERGRSWFRRARRSS